MRTTRFVFAATLLALVAACQPADLSGDAPRDPEPPKTLALPRVRWMDDFLGVAIDPRYALSLGGSGAADVARGGPIGGAMSLSTTEAEGVARVRFGEDPHTGMNDVRPFSADKNVVYEARVMFSTADDLQATVGFIGLHDPYNVIAAIYASTVAPTWQFEVNNEATGAYGQFLTDFRHTPGEWAVFRIVTTRGADGTPPTATLFIDGVERATATVEGRVPTGGLTPEFQLWNLQRPDGTRAPTTLWVDYLSVEQDR